MESTIPSGEKWKQYQAEDGLGTNLVGGPYKDRNEGLWFPVGESLERYDGKEFVHYDLGKDFTFGTFGDVYRGRDGNMWFGSRGGLVRYDGEQWTHFTTEDGLLRNSIKALRHDSQGRLWMARYSALPQGDYTFEAKAVDRDLNYSEPVAVAVEVYHRPFASPIYFDSLYVELSAGESGFCGCGGRARAVGVCR
jgi:hypothetical protein